MFEKKAKEYANQSCFTEMPNPSLSEDIDISNEIEEAYLSGAEYGFQKGIKAKVNTTTLSDYPMKDEWHYVIEGDLPKDEKEVLVCLDKNNYWIGYYSQNTDEFERWHFSEFTQDSEQVIAWKEIVPPKEVEKWKSYGIKNL